MSNAKLVILLHKIQANVLDVLVIANIVQFRQLVWHVCLDIISPLLADVNAALLLAKVVGEQQIIVLNVMLIHITFKDNVIFVIRQFRCVFHALIIQIK